VSGGVRHLVTPVDRCNQSCIEKLEDLLRKAREGEIVSVHGIAMDGKGLYFNFSTETLSRLQIAGALLETAIERLRDDE